MRIGILSDTHGLLRPEALAALAGCEHILHAGDIGHPYILDQLRAIAPVTAIRGNTDTHGPCSELPATEVANLADHLIYLVHSIHDLDLNPTSAGISAVISGHSHQPSIEQREGILFLNPGSCGPRRFNLPCTVAALEITPTALRAHIIPIL